MTSQSEQYFLPLMTGEGENTKSKKEQRLSHESTSHGKCEHRELQLWGLKKTAAVKQLGAETQGPLCLLFYHGSFRQAA